jgi:hypothetical protein
VNEVKSIYIIIEKIATKLKALQVVLGKVSYER